MGRRLDELRRPGRHDVAFRLQRNEWNGTVTPQMVVRAVHPLEPLIAIVGVYLFQSAEKRRGRT